MSRVLAVIGAQYGSEGKGVVVHHLADRFNVHVRVGGPNAGHSFKHNGRLWKMRAVPCGWTNKTAQLFIGAGAVIDPAVLAGELAAIREVDKSIDDRLFVDADAWCIMDEDRDLERSEAMDQEIGSTLEGVGAARARRLRRSPECDHRFFRAAPGFGMDHLVRYHTSFDLNALITGKDRVLLEGTQGCGLSLVHGPWPYVTSADTGAAQLLADCGIAPSRLTDVLLVMRTFPIRVGGHSGDLLKELTWEEMSERVGKKVEERTTVTNRVRRIGEWDESLILRACSLNRPGLAALMFADYLDPEVEGNVTMLSRKVLQFIDELEARFAFKVALVGTGGPDFAVVERRVL